MSDHLFFITGGGTGSKVAEAVTHLCAAGLGPRFLHVLMIDSDTANGNVRRAIATIEAYQAMNQWPWTVEAHVNHGLFRRSSEVGLRLFGTEIHLTTITDEIDTVLNGGLSTAVKTDDMHRVLDLLYDEDEQTATCEDGFRARPNLGCLLLADHLEKKLPEKGAPFLDAIERVVSGGQQHVPIAVTASVFGGTGASLIPIIRGSIENALSNPNATDKLDWSVVKMLPHYQPEKKQASVDPDRYLLDTSSALRFYSTTYATQESQHFDATYLVGSDKPGRNRVKTVLGHAAQANPSYFEEIIAALAILHRMEGKTNGQPVHLYDPTRLHWDTLPYRDRLAFRMNLTYLMHLASFYLQESADDTYSELERGLARFLDTASHDSITAYPWYGSLLASWAATHPTFKSADPAQRVAVLKDNSKLQAQSIEALKRPAAEYFGRLLSWADTALYGEGLNFADRKNGSYAYVYEIMSDVTPSEINRATDGSEASIPFSEDNALARLLRAALVAFVRTHTRASKKGARSGHDSSLIKNDVVQIQATQSQIENTLHTYDLSNVIEEYKRTRT